MLSLAIAGLAGGQARAEWVSPDIRALNRLTFGATPEALESFSRLGLNAWLDLELAKPASDAALDERLTSARLNISYDSGKNDAGKTWDALDEDRPLSSLTSDPKDLLPLTDYDEGFAYEERIRPAEESSWPLLFARSMAMRRCAR